MDAQPVLADCNSVRPSLLTAQMWRLTSHESCWVIYMEGGVDGCSRRKVVLVVPGSDRSSLFLLVVFLHTDLVDAEQTDLLADEGLLAGPAGLLHLGADVDVPEEVDGPAHHVLGEWRLADRDVRVDRWLTNTAGSFPFSGAVLVTITEGSWLSLGYSSLATPIRALPLAALAVLRARDVLFQAMHAQEQVTVLLLWASFVGVAFLRVVPWGEHTRDEFTALRDSLVSRWGFRHGGNLQLGGHGEGEARQAQESEPPHGD